MESIVSSKDRLHFFQYMEVDVLQQYFRTGIHYFVNAILNAYPQLIRFRYYSLEISTFIDFLKDYYYLVAKQSTYAENFFQFQRKSNSTKLGALKSALIWTIIPYLANKIESYYNQIVGEEIDGRRHGFFKKMLKTIFPYIYAIVGLLQVMFKFKYLYSGSDSQDYYNLLYKLDKIHLGHQQSTEQAKYPILELLKKPGILIVLMGHKIITWYFNNKKNKQSAGKEEKVQVSAPIPEERVDQEGRCPICTKQIKNATMVKSSGYVYCFDCINEYVRRQYKCPMSRLSITAEALQLLYP